MYMDFVLSGRDALAEYMLCSDDRNVTFLESDVVEGFILDSYFVPKSKPEDIRIIDGVKYAKFEKALLDLMTYDYDDSAIYECFDFMSEEELESFIKYLKEVSAYEKISSDKRWRSYLLHRV